MIQYNEEYEGEMSELNWSTLFSMQKKLDDYIEKNNSLENLDLFEEKILALIVELGELANETRSFKFWSQRKDLQEELILEEYVDGIHFILSLGLEKGYDFTEEPFSSDNQNLNKQFLLLYDLIIQFKKFPRKDHYKHLFNHYLHLGKLLNISSKQLKDAYIKKNEVNFKRQDEGY